jgi:transglutaminase-like putative cysteine protease
VSPVLDSRVLLALAGLLALAQLPQVVRLPIWLTALGMGLIGLRVALLRRGRPAPKSYWLVPIVIAGGLAIRWHFGYFFGRDPGVALLFLMAGLKFMETRTERDGTLVVCLAAFLAMTQFLYEQSLLAAGILIVTVLTIAFALHALSGTWVRKADGVSIVDALRPLFRLAGIMVLQSVPLALLLFLVFPRLSTPLWGIPTDQGAKTGLSEQMEPGNISELSLSDDIAFHVEFSDKSRIPANAFRYWRGPVLSQFDGRVWRTATRPGPGRFVPATGTQIEYLVTLEPHQQRWLFALDLPSALPANDNGTPLQGAFLTREQQLLSIPLVASRLIYRQSSVLVDRHPGADESELARLLRLPGRANPRARAFAQEERRLAGSDPDFVQAVLRRFNQDSYGYTLTPPEVGVDAVDDFLFQTKRGFCEHYAGAFAFLMRAAGIPARVVTGYLGGEINPASGTMVVRQSDAHAWTEVWIDGLWRRVDPTAAVAPERIQRGLSAALPRGEPVPFLSRTEWSWLRAVQWRWDAVNHNWQKWVIGFNHERQQSLFSELGWPKPEPWQIVGLIAGAFALWGLGYLTWSQWRQRIRTRDPLERTWLRINRQLARAGLPRAPTEGPLAYAERLCARWPQHEKLWRELATGYALARYGQGGEALGHVHLRRVAEAMRGINLAHDGSMRP